MSNNNRTSWVFIIFKDSGQDNIHRLVPALVAIAIYTAIISFIFHWYSVEFVSTTAVHSILGIVLGFFLVFRTNSAYDRWWEGRKIWGMLVNNCRNLSMKLSAMVPKDHKAYDILMEAVSNYPKALKEHLREGVPQDHLNELEEKLGKSDVTHIPNAIAQILIKQVNILKKEGIIDAEQYRVLDAQVVALTDITGMCERIRNTPIPDSYVTFMKKFIVVFIVTLPLAFVTHFGYWTVGIVVLLLYILLSIELLAEEIEDPFGSDVNDLPTDNLSEKIDINVREIMR